MKSVYRILGLAAALRSWGYRHRVLGLPAHWTIGVLAALALSWGIEACWTSGNLPEPERTQVSRVLAGRHSQDFVELQGELIPQWGLVTQATQERPLPTSWVPLLERDTGSVIFVSFPHPPDDPRPRVATVQGMLRPVSADLSNRIPGNRDGVAFERYLFLVEGEKPGNLWLGLALAIGGSLTLAALSLVEWQKGLVFQRARSMSGVEPAPATTVRATGLFSLDHGGQEPCFEEPATLDHRGALRTLRAGSKGLFLDPESLHQAHTGWVYHGRQRRPALRFSALDTRLQRRQTLVVTCDTPGQIRHLWDQLQPAGLSLLEKKAFTLSEVLVSLSILTISLLGLAGTIAYASASGEHAANVTEASTYARELLEYTMVNNLAYSSSPTFPLPASTGLNDSPGATEALNASPFDSTSGLSLPASSRYQRHIQVLSSRLATEIGATYNWKDDVRQISVTIQWTENARPRSVTLASWQRRPR